MLEAFPEVARPARTTAPIATGLATLPGRIRVRKAHTTRMSGEILNNPSAFSLSVLSVPVRHGEHYVIALRPRKSGVAIRGQVTREQEGSFRARELTRYGHRWLGA